MTEPRIPGILRNPLIQFAIAGAVLVGMYAITAESDTDETRRVEISAVDLAFLRDGWTRQWNRPPTEEEMNGLVEARIREEVLYREAVAMGLDQNDMVVRRRMVQKMDLCCCYYMVRPVRTGNGTISSQN